MPPVNVVPPSRPRQIHISADAQNVDLFTLAGSPVTSEQWEFIVDAGVVVGSNSTANPAMTTGAFPAGSVLQLTVKGTVVGRGGNGGHGVNFITSGGTNGAAGGPAIQLDDDFTIDVTDGLIGGGGGGGGGGGAARTTDSFGYPQDASGGGGGGGQGDSGGNGGTRGIADCTASNGSAGSVSAAGSGGAGCSHAGGTYEGPTYGTAYGGTGGTGGGLGESGSNGANGSGSPNVYHYSGKAGGAAGKAVDLNSFSVTWIGMTGSNVLGAVA